MTNYIAHPITREIQEATNFTMFNDWKKQSGEFIEFKAEIVEEDGLIMLKDGSIIFGILTIAKYLEGAAFKL